MLYPIGAMANGEEYYRDNYGDYDRQNSARKLDFYMSLVRVSVPKGARLHELGVGLGNFLARASAEYDCSGTDVNPYGLAEARRRAPKTLLSEGSFEQIPISPPPDIVVAWDVLEHVAQLPSALDCIRQRLASPGFLIAVVPVYDGPLGWLVHRLDHDPTHLWKWSRHAWGAALRRHGFQVIDSGGILRRLLMKRWYLHATWPAPIWRRVGNAVWFVARKA